MFPIHVGKWSRAALLGGALLVVGVTTGCQTNVGGQTLPSAYYLHDDVQYFPAGPEDKLANMRAALEQYRLEEEGIRAGLNDAGP